MVIASNLKKKNCNCISKPVKKIQPSKRKEIFAIRNGIDGIMLSEVSQTEKDKHCVILPFYLIFCFLHCEACGILVPLYWEHRVLTIGLPDLTFMWNLKNKQKAELIQKPRTDWWMNEGGHKGHSSSYKIGKSWGCNVQHGDCVFESC